MKNTNDLNDLENKIGYRFNDRNWLNKALTHSSSANADLRRREESNERLEFLGDSVLNLAVSRRIYSEYGGMSEGEMTKTRAAAVCRASLAKCAELLDLGEYMLMGKGEEITGGRGRSSTTADCFEALIGAIYMDGGFENASLFIGRLLKIEKVDFTDYKTYLQETAQRRHGTGVSYEIVKETGPDHDKAFFSQAAIGNDIIGKGSGRSKKEAEQDAARKALEIMNKRQSGNGKE